MIITKQNYELSYDYCNIEYYISTHLQEYSNDSEPIRLASSLTKTGVFGVPVHQMELRINELYK